MVNVRKQKELDKLRAEHDALENEILELSGKKVVDPFKLRDAKKKKLHLKEEISAIEAMLTGDIVA